MLADMDDIEALAVASVAAGAAASTTIDGGAGSAGGGGAVLALWPYSAVGSWNTACPSPGCTPWCPASRCCMTFMLWSAGGWTLLSELAPGR